MNQRLLKAITALTLSAAIIFPSGDTGLTVSAAAEQQVCTAEEHVHFEAEHYAAGSVAMPGANYKSNTTIECDGDYATIELSVGKDLPIYYSVESRDGAYKKYTSPIKITKDTSIWAYAEENGKKSDIAFFKYYLAPKVNFSVSGTGSTRTVKVSSKAPNVSFYYDPKYNTPDKKDQKVTSSGITVDKSCTIKVFAVKDGWKGSVQSYKLEFDNTAKNVVAKPTANYTSGTTIKCDGDYASIKLSAESGATIYYSLNNAQYKKYSSAIKLTKNSTIKAYSEKNGSKSDVVTYSYKLKPNVTFNASGSDSKKTVKLSTGTSGVKLYYTIDGTKPNINTHAYTSKGITITKSCKVRVLAVKSGWVDTEFSKSYTLKATNNSSGTSSSSSDTKQLGAGSFTEPVAGKGTVRYKGSTNGVFVYTQAYDDCDKFYFNAAAGKTVEFYISSGAKFNTGDTLKLSDLSSVEKGSGYVSLSGFGLRSGADFISSDNDAKSFDKVELNAVSVDYTGKKASTFYFYILAHDESGKKISLEGLAKVNIKDSKRGAASGSSSGSGSSTGTGTGSDTGTGSRPKPMDISEFTDLKIPAEAGKAYIDEKRECDASYKFESGRASSADTYNVKYGSVSYTNAKGTRSYCYPKICIGIDPTVKFETGDTLYLSDFTGEKSASNIIFSGFAYWNDLRHYNRDYCTSIGSDRFKKVVVKAVDMDYTGENPSVIYYYIQVDLSVFEGIIKVKIDNTKRNAPYDPKCRFCGGDGMELCSLCGGTGRYYNVFSREFETCSKCKGNKEIKCDYCNGKGVLS
ncbi:MAG: chitobiase/beta-hexosaminidase C-terminal domain-containing protein [Oscillospiraceae bacterium]|nr:chitobiase/beta-hexosaminidase C-terminal domain-containing protein [Oscillospiraceae bacterium]